MPLVLIVPTRIKMGFLYWDGQVLDDENEDGCQLGVLGLKVELAKMGKNRPLILDVKLPFWNKLSIPYYFRFLNFNKSLGSCDTYLVENRLCCSHSPFCRTTPLVNFPIENVRLCRRTRSVCDLGDLFVEHACSSLDSGNVTDGPSLWTFDSVERSLMARSLMKSSLILQLGTLDSTATPCRAKWIGTSPVKTFGIIGSPFRVRNVLSHDPNSHVTSPGSQIFNLKASEDLLISCSSPNSASSYQSNSSPPVTVSKGIIYCAWKHGSLNFLFKEVDGSGKVYVANMNNIQSSFEKGMDYLYVFRSMTGNKASEFVGKMKVFSSLLLNPNLSKLVETEFVLYGVEDRSKEVHGPTSSATKIKCLSKKVPKISKSNHSLKHKASSKISEANFQFENFLQDFDESEFVNHIEKGFQPSLERAAIVIQSSPCCSKKEAGIGGWGLKFLEKATTDCADTSIENCGMNHRRDDQASWVAINVLIPSGFHGGPSKGNSGPSTLTERWRSGGHCDCGGWDIGCPLTILHGKNLMMPKAFPNDDSQDNCKLVDLFLEGGKHVEPSLKMMTTSDGVHTVHFQPTLSALQAFSIGMAIIHTQAPALYPKL